MEGAAKVGCPRLRLLADAPEREVATGHTSTVTYHCHQAMFSLPRLLGTTLDSIPGPAPYLKAQAKPGWSCRRRKASCGSASSGRVGSQSLDRRSVPFELLIPLLEQERTLFFSLQLGDAAHDPGRAGVEEKIADLSPLMDDFASTTR